jgi:2-dehydro-3-deoxyglucarate aldolase/4-hydroxy-2-oxoheptanedioate aldolase
MTESPRTTIRRRILAGETLIGAWTDMASPLATEITGRAGFDWLIADLEHGAGTEAELLPVLLAAELSGAAAFVRPQSGERLRIGRALDMGAAGIMIPRLDTATQVAEAVSYLRYPPDGTRGVALRTRGARFGSVGHADLRTINADIVGIVQVESPGAVREADAIAAIDGVDVLFVGPADLSHSLRVPGQFSNPTYLAALDAVVAACRRHGKAPGILLYDGAAFGPHLDRGFRFLGVGSEGSFISEGAKAALATARAGIR